MRPHVVLPTLLLAACETAEPEADPAGSSVMLARTVFFERATEGISRGFDLDGSAAAAVDGCGIDDFVAPDGRQGIDNTFANLLPIIELAGGQAVEDLVQDAVDSGEMLVMVEAHGYRDAQPGDCVPVDVLRGAGAPTLGGDGRILPDQTFDRNFDFPSSSVPCGTVLEDGGLELAGFDFRLPLAVFDESIDLTLRDAQLRMTPTDDGWTAVMGGAVDASEIAANVLGFDAIPTSLVDTVVAALDLMADLAPVEGTCTRLSVVLGQEMVPAYFFEHEG